MRPIKDIIHLVVPAILLLLYSCRNHTNGFSTQQQRDVDRFVEYLKNNDEQGVYNMTFHEGTPQSPIDNIRDEQLRRRDVARAADLINTYGLPPKQKWIYKSDPNDPVEPYSVTIPLSEKSNVEKAVLYIAFPVPQVSNKIYRYVITSPEALELE